MKACFFVLLACACTSPPSARSNDGAPESSAALPLVLVADVELPGGAVRFDYQAIDAELGHLVIAHMNDDSVVVVRLEDGAVVKSIPNIPTARGVAVGPEAGRIFVTGKPNKLVILDRKSLAEIARVDTGTSPDGVAWDGSHRIVGVSDQGDGAVSLIEKDGDGKRTQVQLGKETGNVVFDEGRGRFWVTVVQSAPPNQLISIDPLARSSIDSIPLPGCEGAHGLRLHPDGKSAFVACEDNATLVRVDLTGDHAVVTTPSGDGPDVLAIDTPLGWLYVAAESGDVTVFDIGKAGLVGIGSEHPDAQAHTVAVDAATHQVYFPLPKGAGGKPVLRIMKPSGT